MWNKQCFVSIFEEKQLLLYTVVFRSFIFSSGCKPLLLQVIDVEMILPDIKLNDTNAYYQDKINMTAVCSLTSPYHHVNLYVFTSAENFICLFIMNIYHIKQGAGV